MRIDDIGAGNAGGAIAARHTEPLGMPMGQRTDVPGTSSSVASSLPREMRT